MEERDKNDFVIHVLHSLEFFFFWLPMDLVVILGIQNCFGDCFSSNMGLMSIVTGIEPTTYYDV